MRLRQMSISPGETTIRKTIAVSKFGSHWTVYMHPVIAIDGGWFLPDHSGSELRQIWIHSGSVKSLLPKVISQSAWEIWHDLEAVVAVVPSMVIHNKRTGKAVMVHSIDDIGSDIDQVKLLISSCNFLIKDLPALIFTESQMLNEPDEVMMWLCRAFLDPGQSHLSVVRGEQKLVVA